MVYCDRCDRYFSSHRAYWQHVDSSASHNLCDACNIDFSTWVGLKEHWVQSPRHDYCQQCNEHFQDREDLEDHYDECHDWCSQCRKIFKNDVGLREHYRQSPAHHYCADCNRLFNSASNLRNHMNSSIHRPKTITCPARGCGMTFVSGGALTLHLESGTCVSGINRTSVNALVKRLDTNNLITDRRLLTYGQSEEEVRYMATDAAWNGWGYECYFCPRTYGSLNALNQHLASPAHAQKIYVCRGPGCQIKFSALSGLVQHIESQKCGVSKFAAVQNAMDSVLGQMGRLTM